MSVLDKFLDAIRLNDDFDDDDEFFDDEDLEALDQEKPKHRFFKKLDDDEDEEMSSPRSSGRGNTEERQQAQTASKKPSNDTPVLDNFGTDMTKAAEEGRLDPVVGREREIERLPQILRRRKKNNPILNGEP